MKKLIQGILDFRQKCLGTYRDAYSALARGQSPDTLLITCSDSRVAPNVFASTNPGDLFVVRNVGNIIPAYCDMMSNPGCSEAAAIEFALRNLPIKDIIICGHSNCGAMQAILSGIDKVADPHLREWLTYCGCSRHETSLAPDQTLPLENQLAQVSILQQIAHLKTYPIVQERVESGSLNLHGWYFDIGKGDVYNYESEPDRFVLIDEAEANRILKRLM